jgi:amino acid transporter
LADLRKSLGVIEACGFSLSIIAPTLAMAFTTPLTTQAAGRAAPLAYLVGGLIVTLVGLSFVVFGRRVAQAGSVFAYVGSVFGSRCGFVAGWALLLTYVTLLAGSTALVGNFGAAALGHAGVEGPHLWLVVAVSGAFFAVWLTWRDMRMAARVMLLLEAASVLAILLLAIVIPSWVPLSPLPFTPEPGHGWAGIGYGIVFAVLYAGRNFGPAQVTFSCADRRFDERTAPFQRLLAPPRESRSTSLRRRPRGQASARRSFRRASRSRVCACSLWSGL